MNRPGVSGGLITVMAACATAVLMTSTIVSWKTSNNLLQQATLPVDQKSLTQFATLPPALAAATAALPAPLSLASGFSVQIATMGNLCGAIKSFSSSLLSGSFAYAPPQQGANGSSLHTFSCLACMPNAQASLTVVFHASCQSFVVTTTAIGAAGGASAATVTAANAHAPAQRITSFSASFPITLEAVQDGVIGVVADDGFATGGASASGFVALSVESVAAVYGAGDDRVGDTTLSLGLPLQPSYTRYTLSPIQTVIQLTSSVFAWASVFGIFAYVRSMQRWLKELSEKRAAGGPDPANAASGRASDVVKAKSNQRPTGMSASSLSQANPVVTVGRRRKS